MSLTSEQEIIVENAKIGASFKVFAYAGSGKTSTMIHACKEASNKISEFNRYSKGLFLAFNKDIADDASTKLKSQNIRTMARTWHSLAIANIRKDYNKKLNNPLTANKELLRLLYKFFYLEDQKIAIKNEFTKPEENNDKKNIVRYKVVSSRTCKGYILKALNSFFSSVDKDLKLEHFIAACPKWADTDFFLNIFVKNFLFLESQRLLENIFNTELTQYPLSFSAALKIYELSKPKLHNEYDYLIVDEAQDTDLVALNILNNQDLSKIQIIVVGDSFQQIYSWRGALDALDNVRIKDVLYLSKSFRFGPHIAKFASAILKNYFSDFKTIITGNEKIQSKVYEMPCCDYANYDAIITRTNAGAFDAFIKALDQHSNLNIKVNIEVKKIENYILDFEKLLNGKKLGSDSDLILFESITELEEYVKENPTDGDISSPFRLISKVGLAELKEKIKKIINAAEDKKDNQKFDLRITTAHKSKGLQFQNVVIFEDFNQFIFQKLDTTDGEILQYMPISDEEVRLFYVAITRAINSVTLENFSLIFVESLVKSTLKDYTYSTENIRYEETVKNELELCYKILTKHQGHFNLENIENLLSNQNIYNIIDFYMKNKTN